MSETTYYKYISNGDHYTDVITKLSKVEHHLWIGTADIKDLYVKSGSTTIPFLKVISQLIERGVEVRLIHAKEPGPNFRKDFDKYPILSKRLERLLCPRVHFKMVIMDLETVYVGSANLTGAGIGMKSEQIETLRLVCSLTILSLLSKPLTNLTSYGMEANAKNADGRDSAQIHH